MRHAPSGPALCCAAALVCIVAAVGLGLAAPGHATPLVPPGGALPVTASGFRPDTAVILQVAGRAGSATVHADDTGAVHASYPAPRAAGRYRLLASGSADDQSAAPPGNVVVGVPRVVTIVFQVISPSTSTGATSPSEGVSGVSASRATSGGLGVLGESVGRPAPQGAGSLSTTGQDLQRALTAAVGALAAGGLLSLLGRRRRRH